MTLARQTVRVWLTPDGMQNLKEFALTQPFQAVVREDDHNGRWIHRLQDRRWQAPLLLLRRDFIAAVAADWRPLPPAPVPAISNLIGFVPRRKTSSSRK